jgi:hypothetical protein
VQNSLGLCLHCSAMERANANAHLLRSGAITVVGIGDGDLPALQLLIRSHEKHETCFCGQYPVELSPAHPFVPCGHE